MSSSKNIDGTFKSHVVVCYKHFPSNIWTKNQPGGFKVPMEAPSIFGSTKPSLFPQTTPAPRNPEVRNVTSDVRNERSQKKLADADVFVEFDEIIRYCNKFSPQLYVDHSTAGTVKIFKMNDDFPPKLIYSLLINDEFNVQAYRGHKKVATKDIIGGFGGTLTRFSHIDLILERLTITPLDVRSELRSCGKEVLDLADELDDKDAVKRRKVIFTAKQILSLNEHCYTHDDMLEAINLYLRSRSSYRALRELLILPCPNTVRNYFGKYGLTGGAKECKAAVNNVFNSLEKGQKNCFLSFDEIHIKPALQYQGQHVLGNAANASEPTPANCMLALMINPSFGAPAFIARLVPVKNLTADFLFDILKSVLEVIHDAGGEVFSFMCDNLAVNQKCYKIFHENYKSLGIDSIAHPYETSKFEALFTLHDPTHLFKNIRNNWCTEKINCITIEDLKNLL